MILYPRSWTELHVEKVVDTKERYEVSCPYSSGFETLQLGKVEYQAAVDAKYFLLTYMRLEENYLQVLYSLQNFEKFLTDSAIDHSIFPMHEFNETQDARVRANIFVSSFLNSVTGFRNQFPRTGSYKSAHQNFLLGWESAKRTSIAFAFGERLRNYAQHQSHPVSSITSGGGWNSAREHRESHVTVYCDTIAVATDRGDAGERSNYTREFGRRADLTLILREVAGKVGEMMKSARDFLKADFNQAIKDYESALSAGKQLSAENLVVRISKMVGSETPDSHDLFDEFVDRARRLRRNFASVNNHQHFVSSRPRGHLNE